MYYLILDYDVRLWSDAEEFVCSLGTSSLLNYNITDDLDANRDGALAVLRDYLREKNIVLKQEEYVSCTVRLVLTGVAILDERNGDYDVEYELLSSDVVVYTDVIENNDPYQFV